MPDTGAAAILFEAASMAADLVITVTMLYGLIKAKKGLAHTNKVSRRSRQDLTGSSSRA